jgi:hypothetical protein
VLWVEGAHIFGPDVLWTKDKDGRPAAEWPINRALRGVGVRRSRDEDEFLRFGLGRYRSYEDIAAQAADFPV